MAYKGPKTCYRPKVPPPTTMAFTPLGKQILRAAVSRCGVSASDIGEHLLRKYGGELRQEEFALIEEAING